MALRLSNFRRKFISPAIALRSSSAKRVRNVVGRGLALRPSFFLWKIIGNAPALRSSLRVGEVRSIEGPGLRPSHSQNRRDWPPLTFPCLSLLPAPRGLALRPSLFLRKIIGPPGFEPGTSSTPRKRATRLRYGPYEPKPYPRSSPFESLKIPIDFLPLNPLTP